MEDHYSLMLSGGMALSLGRAAPGNGGCRRLRVNARTPSTMDNGDARVGHRVSPTPSVIDVANLSRNARARPHVERRSARMKSVNHGESEGLRTPD